MAEVFHTSDAMEAMKTLSPELLCSGMAACGVKGSCERSGSFVGWVHMPGYFNICVVALIRSP
jgi:hypothetical protein